MGYKIQTRGTDSEHIGHSRFGATVRDRGMSTVEKSKLAVVQDDILAVKFALANGVAFEGLEGKALTDLLKTLQAQRSELLSTTTSKAPSNRTASSKASAKSGQSSPKEKAKKGGAQETGAAKTSPIGTPPKPEPEVSGTESKPAAKRRSPAPAGVKDVPKKVKHKRGDNPLRLLRKTIKVGDIVSVLMDVRMAHGWGRSWVRGEVMREMNRGGIFQIAFDHDNAMAKLVSSEEKGWLREQRLEIDHPDFFCGTGTDPPVGADESRPKGAWYLHSNGGTSEPAETGVDSSKQESSNVNGDGNGTNGNVQSDDNHLLDV